MFSLTKELRAYLVLTTLVMCGILGSLITAPKLIHVGVDFSFAEIVFSILTYPLVDCICELWGKRAARQTLWLGLFSQIILTAIIQLSIYTPYSEHWHLQEEYRAALATGLNVAIASLTAVIVSQLIDVMVYQKIKDFSRGRWLWLRSNISVYLGQTMDSIIFISIVFHDSDQKFYLMTSAIAVKIILSFLMTPFVYAVVIAVNRYLDGNTLAFKAEKTAVSLA